MQSDLKQLHQGAIRFLNQGNIQQAHKALVELVTRKPDFADGYFLMAMVNLRVGQINKAISLLEKTLSLGNVRIEYSAQLAKCYSLTGQLKLAKKIALSVPLTSITNASDADTLGVALTQVGVHEQAIEYFEHALTLCTKDNPEHAQLYYNYGVCAKFLGAFDKAENAFERAILLNSLHHQSHFALADLKKATADHNHISRLQEVAGKVTNPDAHLHIGHALAKEYQDIGNFNLAYQALEEGKAVKHQQSPFDNKASDALFDHIKQLSQDNTCAKSKGCDTQEPIFVLGMPRSGTTLVERILSSHSEVQSAGELQDFGLCVKKLSETTSRHVLDADTLSKAYHVDFEKLGNHYLQSTRVVTGDSKHFIDKLPFNFYYIDLITKALPNAKIICLLRDPMDTCIGNYRQLFTINNPYYSYSLNLLDTAKFYKRFYKLMQHFQSLHNNIKIVNYEELVGNSEGEIKNLVEFCDLKWESACLDFHLNEAPVSTASKIQVRQPLNNKAIGRWRSFKPHTDEIERYLSNEGVIK